MKTITVGINVLNHLLDDSDDTKHKVKNELAMKLAHEIIEELDIKVLEHTFDTDFSVTFSFKKGEK